MYVCVCVCVCMHVCMYVCMYVWIYVSICLSIRWSGMHSQVSSHGPYISTAAMHCLHARSVTQCNFPTQAYSSIAWDRIGGVTYAKGSRATLRVVCAVPGVISMRAKNAGNVAAMHHFGRNVLPQCTAYKKGKQYASNLWTALGNLSSIPPEVTLPPHPL